MNIDSRFKKLKLNTFLSLVYQIVLLIAGLILPKLFLNFYGSAINGLVTSITQFLSFINICDMGISAVVSSAYYKPLAEKDCCQISKIFKYSKGFFNKIGVILIVYVFILSLVYPKVIKSRFSWSYIVMLLLAMSISQFAQFFLGISYQILLNADQKMYVQLVINGGTLVLNTISCILIMYLGGSIHLVKLSTSLIYIFRPLLMYAYVKKHYNLKKAVVTDKDTIPQKWNGVIQHFAYTVYENTDVIILTVFSSLENISIYSVYILVTGAVKSIFNASITSFLPLFGNVIAKNEVRMLENTYKMYEWVTHTITTTLYTITGILIVPFVMLYTKGINDANYYQPIFALLITLAYAINGIRNSMHTIIKAAGHYKQTQRASLIEAVLNFGISGVLVFNFGLIGVAIGTISATIFFCLYEIIYLKKYIICWPIKNVIRRLLIDLLSIVCIIILSSFIKIEIVSVMSLFIMALIVAGISFICVFIIQMIFERKLMNQMLYKLKIGSRV